MSDYNFGPDWLWNLVFFCAAIGFITGIVMAIKGAIWIFNHVHIS